MDKDTTSDESENRHVEWSVQVEDILAGEGEKCRGLAWIHMRCESELSKLNTLVQVPVIVLSTLAGTASVGSSTLFGPGNATSSGIAIGLVSIAVGILNTLGGFFNFAKRSEAHRIAHLHYSKISSKIQIELSLPRLERDSADSLLNYVRDSMERLAETTPLASDKILKDFNHQFSVLKDQISMPPETNGLHKIKIYRSNGPVPTPKFSFDVDVPHFAESSTVASAIASKAQDIVKQAATHAQEQVSSQALQMISDATRQRAQLLQPFMPHQLPPPQLHPQPIQPQSLQVQPPSPQVPSSTQVPTMPSLQSVPEAVEIEQDVVVLKVNEEDAKES
jgi:hypothetical protein